MLMLMMMLLMLSIIMMVMLMMMNRSRLLSADAVADAAGTNNCDGSDGYGGYDGKNYRKSSGGTLRQKFNLIDLWHLTFDI